MVLDIPSFLSLSTVSAQTKFDGDEVTIDVRSFFGHFAHHLSACCHCQRSSRHEFASEDTLIGNLAHIGFWSGRPKAARPLDNTSLITATAQT